MRKVAVITGAGAGVGRAAAPSSPATVAMWACCRAILNGLKTRQGKRGVSACAHSQYQTDVADAEAVEAAATRVEEELGPIDVWVNVAMATVFSPVSKLTAAEVERGTAVTYLRSRYTA